MPILAATVGVLGGLGGALVGGFLTNQGQAEGFKRERAAALQDSRVEAYADFLGTAEGLVEATKLGDEDKQQELQVKLFVSRARVFLVFENPEVEKAATDVGDVVTRGDPTKQEIDTCANATDWECIYDKRLADYEAEAKAFLARAREEIAETTE